MAEIEEKNNCQPAENIIDRISNLEKWRAKQEQYSRGDTAQKMCRKKKFKMYKKSFPLRIFSENCGFGHIYWKKP